MEGKQAIDKSLTPVFFIGNVLITVGNEIGDPSSNLGGCLYFTSC